MKLLKITGSALLLGTSSFALAQDAPEEAEAQDEFGAMVSAYAQENAQNGGIGEYVSEQAQALAAQRRGQDDGDADAEEISEDEESEGIGETVSAAAQEAAQSEDGEPGSVADAVLANTPAADEARDAVADAAAAAADGRARADEARLSAASAASAARETADAARQNAANAREAAQSARDNARNIPRPGRPG